MPRLGPPAKFHVRVNRGSEETIEVFTGSYRDAAAAVPALLRAQTPCTVEIWCPRQIENEGPFLFRLEEDTFGRLVVRGIASVHHGIVRSPDDKAVPDIRRL